MSHRGFIYCNISRDNKDIEILFFFSKNQSDKDYK